MNRLQLHNLCERRRPIDGVLCKQSFEIGDPAQGQPELISRQADPDICRVPVDQIRPVTGRLELLPIVPDSRGRNAFQLVKVAAAKNCEHVMHGLVKETNTSLMPSIPEGANHYAQDAERRRGLRV